MKSGVAIALIVCGTILLVTPAINNYLVVHDVAAVMRARTDLNRVDLTGMPDGYEYLCWAAGIAMAVVAVAQSVRLPWSRRAGEPVAE